jgi:VanZ family protein
LIAVNLSVWLQRRRALLWIPPVIYAALIFHFSSEPEPLPLLTQHVWDKALHVIEYAGLALLICRAFRGERVAWSLSIALSIIIASAYAGSDEWHQRFVLNRDSNAIDWVADTIGAVIGSAAYRPIASHLGGPL